MPGLELERLAHEPPQRRVMGTFAQALAAIDRIIVTPERTPTGGELQGAVVAGATANWSLPCVTGAFPR
jgi:hypothetical protein